MLQHAGKQEKAIIEKASGREEMVDQIEQECSRRQQVVDSGKQEFVDNGRRDITGSGKVAKHGR